MKNKQLQEYPEKELRLELERRGYFTRNLWQVEDVRNELDDFNAEFNTSYSITDEQCLDVLENVFSCASETFEAIQWILRDRYTFKED